MTQPFVAFLNAYSTSPSTRGRRSGKSRSDRRRRRAGMIEWAACLPPSRDGTRVSCVRFTCTSRQITVLERTALLDFGRDLCDVCTYECDACKLRLYPLLRNAVTAKTQGSVGCLLAAQSGFCACSASERNGSLTSVSGPHSNRAQNESTLDSSSALEFAAW